MSRGFGLAATLAAVFALMTAPVSAHGPTRQKVTETVEINAPADKVWAIVGNFQDMSWHPAVEKTEGAGDSAVGATRTLTLKGGGIIKEAVEKYDAAKMMLQYEIKEVDVKVLPVTTYQSWITVTANGDKSTLEWKGKFYRGDVSNEPPPELGDDAAVNAVTGIYKAGLEAVKKKAEGG